MPAVSEFEVLLHDGQPRPYSPDVAFHGLDCRGESGKLCAVLARDARALVGEPDGAAVVENGYGCFLETRVDEVFRHLADDGVGNGSACRFRLLINACGKVFDELCGGRRLDLGYVRRAEQVIV